MVAKDSQRGWGQIEILPVEKRPEWADAGLGFSLELYRWTPNPHGPHHLPRTFQLRFLCCTGPDGQRRLVPEDRSGRFLWDVVVGGIELVIHQGGGSAHDRQMYWSMMLLHLRTHLLREHLGRAFKCKKDLRVTKPGRRHRAAGDVLPPDLGSSPREPWVKWSSDALIEQGRAVAEAEGRVNPTLEQLIQLGLFEAARRNPDSLPTDQVVAVVRLALYMPSKPVSLSARDVEVIEGRLLEAIFDHRDDTGDEFVEWFCGPKSTLLKQIAKQRNAEGGPYSMDDVRSVLLNLGWDSYTYVAQCVSAQMEAVAAAIPQPLTPAERRLFDVLYIGRPFLADLPFMLMTERLPELKIVLADLASDAGWLKVERQPSVHSPAGSATGRHRPAVAAASG